MPYCLKLIFCFGWYAREHHCRAHLLVLCMGVLVNSHACTCSGYQEGGGFGNSMHFTFSNARQQTDTGVLLV